MFMLAILFFSDWERNVELAQLIQQKLDAYKVVFLLRNVMFSLIQLITILPLTQLC